MLLALGKCFERSQAIGRFNTVIAEGRADLLCGARSIARSTPGTCPAGSCSRSRFLHRISAEMRWPKTPSIAGRNGAEKPADRRFFQGEFLVLVGALLIPGAASAAISYYAAERHIDSGHAGAPSKEPAASPAQAGSVKSGEEVTGGRPRAPGDRHEGLEMGRRSEDTCLHHRRAHLHDLGRAAANLLLTLETRMVDPE